MALSQPNRREISLKVVYYGPGLAGKATSLDYLHGALRADARGQMISVVTGGDRTMFFDFFPPPSPRLQGNALRVQLYTTPGEVQSESTHRGLLEGVDAVVFVADSQRARTQENIESMERLRQGLLDLGLSLGQLPHVFAWNKRDLDDVIPVEDLAMLLNRHQALAFETVATAGRGVFDTLKAVTGLLVTDLSRRRGKPSALPGANGRRVTPPNGTTLATDRARLPEAIDLGLQSQPTTLKPRSEELVPVTSPRALRPSPPPPEHKEVPSLHSEDTQHKSAPSTSWLQPLSPEAMERPSSTTRPLWLSQITPSGPLRDQLHDMELDLATGHYAQAVRRATIIFSDLTQRAATQEAEEGQAWRALSLGIPVDRYLRFREAVRNAEVGTATMEDGLYTLFFLLDASLRR